MAMSVGTCECGCGEFDHQVGGWEELDEAQHGVWQKHRCDSRCASPCLVARCRESDGYWTWCPNCEVLCSGWFGEFSDEPSEDGVEYEEIEPMPTLRSNWPPLLGTQIQVDFHDGRLTVTQYAVLTEGGDPRRQSLLPEHDISGDVYACYAGTNTGEELLIFPNDLV